MSDWRSSRANRSSASGEPCRQEERPDGRPSRPDEFIPEPHELVPRNRTPDTIAGWKAVADGLLSDPCCAFHRNVEISSRYASIWRPQRLGRGPMISFGRATSRSSSMSSAPWCNPTSITSRAHPPGSSRSARPRASRCMGCGRRLRASPRSTSTRSPEESRTLCVHKRGRGSPASRTAGAGSWQASFRASGDSTPTHAWSTPACGTSSTKRAISRRDPASCRVHPQTAHGELRNRGDGTGHGPKDEQVAGRPAATRGPN
jgi:hypothetical protein